MPIEPGFVDAPSLDGLGWSIPQPIVPGFVDGAVTPPGPLVVRSGAAVGTFTPRVTVSIFGPAGINKLADIENAEAIRWQDELNGVGIGEFDLAFDDADAAQCIASRMVRIYLDQVPIFTFQIEGRPRLFQIQEGEESAYRLRVSGRGWASIMDDAITFPSRDLLTSTPDLDDPFKQERRFFNFASIDFPNGQDWPLSIRQYEYPDLQGFRFSRIETSPGTWENLPAPVGFPFPNSEIYTGLATIDEKCWWITPPIASTAPGWFFFAGIFINPAFQPVTFAMTGDSLFTFWINGVPVLGERDDHFMWQGWKEATIPLEAGWYRLCCAIENVPGSVGVGESNHGGWLMGSFVRGSDGNPKSGAITTNGLWKSYYSPEIWPGWTPGQILIQLIVEAQARGAVLSGALNFDFAHFADSNGNAWQALQGDAITSYIPHFSVRIGSTLVEALDELHKAGWIDWYMTGGGSILRAWSAETGGVTTGATFTEGTNIATLEREASAPFANFLLVSWEDGYVEVFDAASVAADGKHEDVYDSGATSEEEATRRGNVELQHRLAGAGNESIVMGIENLTDATTPYIGCSINDFDTAPDADGATQSCGAVAVAGAADDMGDPTFILTLGRPVPVLERQEVKLLRSIGGKTLDTSGAI
jgi:hypothetical protein